ncbi:MAG: IPT/TIG domain-containing protein, partial [Pyrinomonadaceae bacterium]
MTSVNGSGTATALNGGEADISASFSGRYYYIQECYPQYGPETGYANDEIRPNLPGCGDCDWDLALQQPQRRLRVKPRITSITPGRGLINSTISVSIDGSGFAGGSTVSVAGTGVTASVQSSSATSLSVNLNISANATPGNHGVTVTTSGKTSNSVNFFVQVPTSLRRDSISGVNDQQGGCGATRTLLYRLLDQEGAEISSGDTLKETFSNFSGPAGVAPPAERNVQLASGVAIDTIGYQIPDCPPPFTATFSQTFAVVIGTQSYSLTTSNAIS